MNPNAGYAVLLHRDATQDLDKARLDDFRKLEQEIRNLGNDPRPRGARKITKNIYRVRQGDWRIFYSINDTMRELTVYRVLRRNERTYDGWK